MQASCFFVAREEHVECSRKRAHGRIKVFQQLAHQRPELSGPRQYVKQWLFASCNHDPLGSLLEVSSHYLS